MLAKFNTQSATSIGLVLAVVVVLLLLTLSGTSLGWLLVVALALIAGAGLGWLGALPSQNEHPEFLKFKDSLPAPFRKNARAMYERYLEMQKEPSTDVVKNENALTTLEGIRGLGRRLESVGPRAILILGAAMLLLVVLFPPFFITLPDGVSTNLGHAYLLTPPKYGMLIGRIDALVLIAEILAIVCITAIGAVLACLPHLQIAHDKSTIT